MNEELDNFQLVKTNKNEIITETIPDIITENEFFKDLTDIMEDENL